VMASFLHCLLHCDFVGNRGGVCNRVKVEGTSRCVNHKVIAPDLTPRVQLPIPAGMFAPAPVSDPVILVDPPANAARIAMLDCEAAEAARVKAEKEARSAWVQAGLDELIAKEDLAKAVAAERRKAETIELDKKIAKDAEKYREAKARKAARVSSGVSSGASSGTSSGTKRRQAAKKGRDAAPTPEGAMDQLFGPRLMEAARPGATRVALEVVVEEAMATDEAVASGSGARP
jgi:hypothetical protein